MTKEIALQQRAEGLFNWQVVESATGRVVREAADFRKNLILYAGLDYVAGNAHYWAACMENAAAGSDNTATTVDSGTTQATQSGTTVSLSGGVDLQFTSNDVGNVIKWDTGEESTITSFSSATSVQASPAHSVATGDFTLYRTNQTGLISELKRNNSYLTGAGNCGTTVTQNGNYAVVQYKRTFEFSTESGTVNYNEAGVSWTPTPGANLFSRFILDNAPVTVNNGEQLRLIYVLNLTIFPCQPQTRPTLSISGWPTASGQESSQMLGMFSVNTNGVTIVYDASGGGLEPGGSAAYAILSTDSSALKAFLDTTAITGAVSGSPKIMSLESYTSGTYTRRKSVTFAANEGNSSSIRKLVLASTFGSTGSAVNGPNQVILLDSAQEKLNTHTLTLHWRFTWGRVL